jgi:hypothetical protein
LLRIVPELGVVGGEKGEMTEGAFLLYDNSKKEVYLWL